MKSKLVLVSFFAFLFVACSGKLKDGEELRIEDVSVSKSRIDKIINNRMKQLAMRGNPISADDSVKFRKYVIDDMTGQTLFALKGMKDGIVADTSEVNRTISQMKASFKSDSALTKSLDEYGLTYDIWVDEVKRNSVASQYLKKTIFDVITVPDSFYVDSLSSAMKSEQVKASHILLSVDPNASQEVSQKQLNKLGDIRKQIIASKGSNFASLAKKYSDDKGSGAKGGDLGYFGRGAMVQEFDAVAFTLPVGEVSDVFRTQFGYHILRVEDKKLTEAPKEQIQQYALAYTRRKKSMQLLEDLKKEFKVLTIDSEKKS